MVTFLAVPIMVYTLDLLESAIICRMVCLFHSGQEVSKLQLDHKALDIVNSASIKNKVQYMYQTCVLNSWRVGLGIRSVRQMFTCHAKYLFTPK